jgi:hypothetical protein
MAQPPLMAIQGLEAQAGTPDKATWRNYDPCGLDSSLLVRVTVL